MRTIVSVSINLHIQFGTKGGLIHFEGFKDDLELVSCGNNSQVVTVWLVVYTVLFQQLEEGLDGQNE